MKKNVFFIILCLLMAACQPGNQSTADSQKLKVVATTTIAGDIVRQVAGDLVDLTVLLPPGIDPHSFQPSPQDVAAVTKADLVFENGAGLEEFMQPLLQNAGGKAKLVSLSEGINLLASTEIHPAGKNPEATLEQTTGDPHTWFDPANVITWVNNIQVALSATDPQNAATYQANADAYILELNDLDQWIQGQVEQIPPEKRLLVTDHASLTYFAEKYGFQQVGAVIPAYSSLAEPSAQELAGLEEKIKMLGVKAIFISEAINPTLAERIAQDTGVQLVQLYNGSLSEPNGPAANYLDFMRYNVGKMVEALQ
jgi:manganese/iron transport system substrate-binding protein